MLILSANLFFFSEKYHQNPLGGLLKQSRKLLGGISLIIHLSIGKLFGENSMGFPLNPFKYHWTEEVQKALIIPPKTTTPNSNKRTPAFNRFCEKATKWIEYLPDIRKLDSQFDISGKSHEGENEDEDEDEKEQMQKKSLLLEKVQRMIKIMLDIAEAIEDPFLSEIMQGLAYDIEKGDTCTRLDGFSFYVKKEEHLSEAQLELSPFAYYLAHPSPEERGISF